MRHARFVVLLLTVVVLACQGPEPMLDRKAVSAEVEEMLSDYLAASNAGEYDRVLTFFVQDERFQWAEDGSLRYRSFEELQTAIKSLSDYGGVSTSYSDQRVTVLSPELASVFALFQTTIGDPEAGGFSFSGAATMNVIRSESGWKIMSGHSSSYRERSGN